MKIEGITPNELHDAVLESLSYTWEDGYCLMLFRIHPGNPISIMFEGVTKLNVPRECPWGASHCVNELRDTADGVVEVEMQSGDVITLHAKSARLMI